MNVRDLFYCYHGLDNWLKGLHVVLHSCLSNVDCIRSCTQNVWVVTGRAQGNNDLCFHNLQNGKVCLKCLGELICPSGPPTLKKVDTSQGTFINYLSKFLLIQLPGKTSVLAGPPFYFLVTFSNIVAFSILMSCLYILLAYCVTNS